MTAQRLIVMRHAKAGELPGGPDAERALRPRGCRDASAAGRWLSAQGATPDLVLCSSARRARQTWQYVSAELAGEPEVVNDPRLYPATAWELVEIIAQVPERVRTLMYVGHNPAAAELIEILATGPADFPTSAIAVIGLAANWADLGHGDRAGAGELIASWRPQADVG